MPEIETETITYQRGKAKKQRSADCVTDSGLRFGADVPIRTIVVPAPELSGPNADQYDVVDTRKTYRLAQRPASYEVLCYERPVLKRRGATKLITTPAPANVLDNSLADVSFLAGLLIDKFLYHLPLYRQHQRLQHATIDLSRATLTNLVKQSAELLRPIANAMLPSILASQVIAIDETPIKAGNKKKGMKQAWFWPILGDRGEIVFTYSPSRGRQHIEQILAKEFSGTLVSDGYSAYRSYVAANQQITHAQCWVHTRRYFMAAKDGEPDAERVLEHIAYLYQVEKRIAKQQLSGEKKRDYRLEFSKPVVDQLPKDPLIAAINYSINREHELRVFLEDPEVPLDNNHTERALRPIAVGRKNWLCVPRRSKPRDLGVDHALQWMREGPSPRDCRITWQTA